jgi:hypothetical protein
MSNCNKPERLTADGLAQAAACGVTRAIEARRMAGVALSDADVKEVSGGLTLNPILIRGIPPLVNLSAALNPAVNPAAGVTLQTGF